MEKGYSEIERQTFGQVGGVGRYTVPLHTAKRRTTTNLETKTARTDRKSNCMEVRQPGG